MVLTDTNRRTGRLGFTKGLNNRNSFYAYRDGKIEPKVTQAEAVESVFNRFGITNIWGV